MPIHTNQRYIQRFVNLYEDGILFTFCFTKLVVLECHKEIQNFNLPLKNISFDISLSELGFVKPTFVVILIEKIVHGYPLTIRSKESVSSFTLVGL